MLTAILTDIHANREALTACLAHAAHAGARRYVFLGDYVGYGADPAFVLDLVMRFVQQGAVAVLGNHDQAAIIGARGMSEAAQAAIEWTRPRLNDAHRNFLSGLPLTIEDADRLFVHAGAVHPERWDYVIGRKSAADSLLAASRHATFCGHVHVPALYHLSNTGKVGELIPTTSVGIPLLPRRRWLAVIGAVGQPRDRNPAACYGLLDEDTDVLTYLRVPYDTATAARKIREAGLPPSLGLRLESGY